MSDADIRPFTIVVPDSDLDDLRRRLAATRWPDHIPGSDWDYGCDLAWLQDLAGHWADGYDWRAAEAELNALDHVVTEVDGQRIHAIHQRSPHDDALPLVLSHGWPGSVIEFLDMVGPLTGYDRYGVQGGDWGSMISRHIAQVDPDHVVGCHVNMMAAGPTGADDDFADVTPLEQQLMDRLNWYLAEDNGYFRIQETRPQTLGTALNDSPAGLLSWIGEKFRGWTDNDGDPFTAVDRDRLLTNVSVYWFTQTINSSTRMYFETSKGGLGSFGSLGDVPLGVSIFPKEIMGARRRWVEPQFNLTFWADHEVGGHFAALEQPEALVDDLRAFFRPLR